MAKRGRKPKAKVAPSVMEWQWRWNFENVDVRIWKADWPGDRFEVVPAVTFRTFENLCDKLGIPLEQADD